MTASDFAKMVENCNRTARRLGMQPLTAAEIGQLFAEWVTKQSPDNTDKSET